MKKYKIIFKKTQDINNSQNKWTKDSLAKLFEKEYINNYKNLSDYYINKIWDNMIIKNYTKEYETEFEPTFEFKTLKSRTNKDSTNLEIIYIDYNFNRLFKDI